MTRRTIFRLLNVAGVLLALAAAVPTAARVLEPEHGWPVPALAAFTPWTVPLWVLAALLLLAGRGRRSGVVVALVAVLVIGLGVRWQVPPGAARDAAVSGSAPGVEVRVMTMNVEYGEADVAQVLDLVRRHRVDVLVVEELTPSWIERFRTAGGDRMLPDNDLHPAPQAAGTGIWSRWRLENVGMLPTEKFAMPMAAVTVPGVSQPLGVTGVHTRAPANEEQIPSWRRDLSTIALVESSRAPGLGPQIYAGDFNASRDHSGFRAVLDTGLVDAADAVPSGSWPGFTGFTWPADRAGPPFTRIDHILVTPDSIGVRTVDVVAVRGTDHRGVVAELVLHP